MWKCVITSIIHTHTEYVTFNSDNDFVPGEVGPYSEIVDTINLVTMTHTIFFFPRFIFNNIEWVLNMYKLLF